MTAIAVRDELLRTVATLRRPTGAAPSGPPGRKKPPAPAQPSSTSAQRPPQSSAAATPVPRRSLSTVERADRRGGGGDAARASSISGRQPTDRRGSAQRKTPIADAPRASIVDGSAATPGSGWQEAAPSWLASPFASCPIVALPPSGHEVPRLAPRLTHALTVAEGRCRQFVIAEESSLRSSNLAPHGTQISSRNDLRWFESHPRLAAAPLQDGAAVRGDESAPCSALLTSSSSVAAAAGEDAVATSAEGSASLADADATQSASAVLPPAADAGPSNESRLSKQQRESPLPPADAPVASARSSPAVVPPPPPPVT